MTINEFPTFARIVAASFQAVAKAPQVYVTNVDGDALYRRYLAAFPEGTNPLFKKATEHECSCCRHFIRRAGNVVTVDDHGVVRTVWSKAATMAPHPYDVVASALRDAVLAEDISDLYRVGQKENSFGAAATRSLDEGGKALTWNHLHTDAIPKALQAASPDQVRGDYRTTVQVFRRGLDELAPSALDAVLALIEANNLYRGAEHQAAVVRFMAAQITYRGLGPREQSLFAWTHAASPASRLRNTVIGTLVQDLSDGVDVERAVASFEQKVAPTNYKRTTAVITPAMVKKAMETIETLGLEPALERRFATISDISVNDVKWVDGSIRPAMKGGLADTLMQVASTVNARKDEERAEDIGLEAFVEQVLPTTTSMEVLLKGEHLGNLMSLTAPVNREPKQLFRWDNDFAWSYAGNVADSIAERVKKAGGKVEGAVLRISLSWFNYDDLDLHVYEPAGRGVDGLHDHIYFSNKRGATGGTLDVDMNAGSGTTREAVENVVWMDKMPNGAYKVVVNNYAQREVNLVGFVVEVECGGKLSHFCFNKTVRNQQDVHVVTLHMKGGLIDRVETGDPAITASNISQTKWGLSTEQYVKVDMVTLSPNHWGDNAVGNKHTFFVLRGANNDEPTRGIYNEFLHPRLEPHRKVFEVIGDKTKCQPTYGQLSGLGFSSTKRTSFLARVQQGKKQRLFNVHVGS
jgi:hypothetical protein